MSTKADLFHDFFVLHNTSCGTAPEITPVQGNGALRARCPKCGDEITVPFTLDEAEELFRGLQDDREFADAMQRAERRIVQ